MERIHFLRKPTGLIIVRVNHKDFPSGRFHYSTGQNVTEANWVVTVKDKDVKGTTAGSVKRDQDVKGISTYKSLRSYLEAIRAVCEAHLGGYINALKLKAEIEELSKRQPKPKEKFYEQWEEIIKTTKTDKGEPIAAATLRSKKQSMHKAILFDPDLSWMDVSLEIYHKYYAWLQEKTPRTVGKHIKELKAILRQAEDRGIKVNQDYKKKSFIVPRPETESTYLSTDEIQKVYTAKVPKKLEKIRDTFVLACCMGQRISDWHQLVPSNVEDGLLKVVQEKTGATVYIPVHDMVRMIWNKYNGLPELLSDQKFNAAIKDVCAEAELGTIRINGKVEEKRLHISSHTARRSFASNAFLAGMDTLSIRRITGHKSEAAFLRYIRLDEKQHGIKAKEHSFFTSKMKVAS